MAKLFMTDGTTKVVFPKKGKTFTLEELQRYVGGDIEIIHHPNNLLFVVNEEGKLRGLLVNYLATLTYQTWVNPNDVLVGNVLLCRADQIE